LYGGIIIYYNNAGQPAVFITYYNMKRDQLILLLQPYKNGLMPKKELAASVNRFGKLLLELCDKYPRLRFNAGLPGYILECMDPLTVSSLRDMTRRGSVEWLCTGYTEPFSSFSPLWLTGENIALGVKTFSELTGEPSAGYLPPFSNWEPSHIDMLGGAGLKYAVISGALAAKSEAGASGYWITEHTGSSMAVFPAKAYHKYNAPKSLMEWINDICPDNPPDSAPKMLILKYLYSLETENNAQNPQDDTQNLWLEEIAADIDKHILEFQPLRFKDALDNISPLGLHYFPPSLVTAHNEPAPPYFLNHLHCYDQIGVMQRKLMDVCDTVRELKESKAAAALKRQLFFAQDINRFLPSERAGFCCLSDRLWTYGKLINIEQELSKLRDAQNGVIRLTDFLRNGYKSIIMSNRALKLYLDHKNGAQAYELDFCEQSFNVCAAYSPRVRSHPNVVIPRESRLAFSDRIFAAPPVVGEYIKGNVKDCSNFSDSPFEYTFKNSPAGVRVLMNCNGGFISDGRTCPLTMDKVFGFEKDSPVLLYSYKLGNTSLTSYDFTFGIEIPLALPGCSGGNVRIIGGRKKFKFNGAEPVIIDDVNEWIVEDNYAGVRIEFVVQKTAGVWMFSPDAPQAGGNNSNGATMLILCPIVIEPSSAISFTGKITFKKIRARGANDDSL